MDKVVVIDKCAILHLMYADCWYLLKALNYSVITTDKIREEFEKGLKKGHRDSYDFFMNLLNNQEITIHALEIDDIIVMAKIPQSNKASDADLSCFALCYRLGCKVMTDDSRATNYIKRQHHLTIPSQSILNIKEIVLEAYINYIIGDDNLRSIQEKLRQNKYTIKDDLVYEGARRRLMI